MEGLFLQNINAGYDNKIIIKNLTLEVKPQETVVIMGTSGAGKTTLLKTILGIIHPHSGSIVLNGKDITTLPIEKRNIGYLSQFYGLFPHMTVGQNIEYGLKIRGASLQERTQKIKEFLQFINLSDFEHANVKDLSGGQQQRVALARTLAINPDLILLDEPLSNIDQVTKLEVAQYLKDLFESLHIPVILVTHQWEDAKFLGKKIAIMIDGKIEQMGTFDEIIQNPKSKFIKKLLIPYAQENF